MISAWVSSSASDIVAGSAPADRIDELRARGFIRSIALARKRTGIRETVVAGRSRVPNPYDAIATDKCQCLVRRIKDDLHTPKRAIFIIQNIGLWIAQGVDMAL